MKTKSCVLLMGGGIESTTLLYEIKDKYLVHIIHLNYGQETNSKEVEAINSLLSQMEFKYQGVYHGINFNQALFSNTKDGYVMRNCILASIGINFAKRVKADRVYMGCSRGEFLDQSAEFIDRFNFMLQCCMFNPVYLFAPYCNWTKARVIKEGIKLNIPFDLTTSCSKTFACGSCGCCKIRSKYNIKIN